MDKLKIVFIGGLTNGKIVYDYLLKNKYVDLSLVITYPNDQNKPRFVNFPDKANILKSKSANIFFDKICLINPDYIFVAGWSELLSDDLINLPKNGTIGFHPAKLPKDRGRSVLAWQIEEGYTETALTMFYYTDVPDGGDIIAQESIKIAHNDHISDILDKLDDATFNVMRAYFPLLRQGKAPRIQQNHNMATFRRLRGDRESLINWNMNSIEIYNKVRAIAPPYPCAMIKLEGRNIKVIQSNILSLNKIDVFDICSKPGTVMAKLMHNRYIIKSRDGFLLIQADCNIEVGTIL